MGTDAKQLYLQILSDYFACRATALPEGLEDSQISELASVAHAQQTEGICYAQTKLPVFQKAFAAASFYYLNRRNLLGKIEKAFTEAKIPYLLLKGTELSELYPNPALRSMGDSDLLVHPEDKEKAHGVLLSLGFSAKQGDTQGGTGRFEWKYRQNGVEIELHHALIYKEETAYGACERAFGDRIWEQAFPMPQSTRCRLEPAAHFVYLILHLKKHLINRGVGFRQFYDLAFAATKWDVDWTKAERMLNELNVSAFAKTAMTVCERWLGTTLPMGGFELAEGFLEDATEQIFCNGVFGFENEKNKENQALYEMHGGGSVKVKRMRMAVKRMFPSYGTLKEREEYRFLRGRPYLLPIAWGVRFWRSIQKKKAGRALRNIKRNRDIPAETVTKRGRYLKQWGL